MLDGGGAVRDALGSACGGANFTIQTDRGDIAVGGPPRTYRFPGGVKSQRIGLKLYRSDVSPASGTQRSLRELEYPETLRPPRRATNVWKHEAASASEERMKSTSGASPQRSNFHE